MYIYDQIKHQKMGEKKYNTVNILYFSKEIYILHPTEFLFLRKVVLSRTGSDVSHSTFSYSHSTYSFTFNFLYSHSTYLFTFDQNGVFARE